MLTIVSVPHENVVIAVAADMQEFADESVVRFVAFDADCNVASPKKLAY